MSYATYNGKYATIGGEYAILGGGGTPGPVSPVVYDTPGDYVFTVPAGVTSITVECWGGGGGAGNADTELSSTYGDSSAGTATHYGNRGGTGTYFGSSGYGGGGGGAGGIGGAYGKPGAGISINISGTSKTYACGGPAFTKDELPNIAGNGGKAQYGYQDRKSVV